MSHELCMHAVATLVIVIHTLSGTSCEYIAPKESYDLEVNQLNPETSVSTQKRLF